MKIMFKGTEVGHVTTNMSITIEQALYYGLNIDVDSQEDCKNAYESGAEYAYLDDCGFYHIDIENMALEE